MFWGVHCGWPSNAGDTGGGFNSANTWTVGLGVGVGCTGVAVASAGCGAAVAAAGCSVAGGAPQAATMAPPVAAVAAIKNSRLLSFFSVTDVLLKDILADACPHGRSQQRYWMSNKRGELPRNELSRFALHTSFRHGQASGLTCAICVWGNPVVRNRIVEGAACRRLSNQPCLASGPLPSPHQVRLLNPGTYSPWGV